MENNSDTNTFPSFTDQQFFYPQNHHHQKLINFHSPKTQPTSSSSNKPKMQFFQSSNSYESTLFMAPPPLFNQNKPNNSSLNDPNADFVVLVSPTTLLNPKRYICDVCYKGFARPQNLSFHQQSHNIPSTLKKKKTNGPEPIKVFPCPEPTCDRHNPSFGLGDFAALRKHYLRKHHPVKEYKCDTCPKEYSCEDDLKSHYLRKHHPVKEYKCDTCPKEYSCEDDLKSHSMNCNQKKHVCACGYQFKRLYDYNNHVENCDALAHEGTPKNQQPLYMGISNNVPIYSSISHLTTPDIGENTIITNSNENLSTHINQNQLNTNFFTPTSTNQNQQGCPYKFDIKFYEDCLMNKIPLQNPYPEDMSLMEGNGNIYGTCSKSFLDGDVTLDSRASPTMKNTSLNGLLNPVNGGNYEYGGYNGGMEVFNFKTSTGTRGFMAPPEQHLNQHGFWF